MAFSAFDITTTVRDEWLYSSGIQEILNHWPTHKKTLKAIPTPIHRHTNTQPNLQTNKHREKHSKKGSQTHTNLHPNTIYTIYIQIHSPPTTLPHTWVIRYIQTWAYTPHRVTGIHKRTQIYIYIYIYIYIILYYIKLYYAIIYYYDSSVG